MAIKDETLDYADPIIRRWPETGSFLIFDLEYTAWEGSHARGWSQPWEHREIIEIGAVRIFVEKDCYASQQTFHLYVRPTVNKSLSNYISRLTGITDALLAEKGKRFPEALKLFCEFINEDEPLFSNGFDGAVLRENCILNKLEYPFKKGQVINIRPALAAILKSSTSETNSSDLPRLVGIKFQAVTHSALGDALSITAALMELKKKGRLS